MSNRRGSLVVLAAVAFAAAVLVAADRGDDIRLDRARAAGVLPAIVNDRKGNEREESRGTIERAAANIARKATPAARSTLQSAKLRRGEWRALWAARARDYTTALDFVGRHVFPGTRWWLISCAKTEGGFGAFVLNRQGSGAGGWLQFMPGTFWGYREAAHDAARRRGFRVPRRHLDWRDPLGQALVGAHMLLEGERGQWEGAGC